MTEIIPAILPRDFSDLRESLARVRFLSPFVQIDICDGVYVESTTWPYADSFEFLNILKGDDGLPFWKDFQFEFDLMVENPEEVLSDWIDAGASRIIIHNKSTQKLEEILEKIKYAGIERGVAIQIDEDISLLDPFIENIEFVQCMGIREIGVQGNEFDPRVLEKIRSIRERFPNVTISIDGGVDMKSAALLAAAGANRLVSGSAILKALDPKEAFKKLELKANGIPNSPQP